jgi:hypothetical protein
MGAESRGAAQEKAEKIGNDDACDGPQWHLAKQEIGRQKNSNPIAP